MNEFNDIIVAIHCFVYNHEPYIRECLEGFVMQQTNFKFVAIVHDDASTDKTADIIREYEAKYPEIIKPIYETENQYSKRDGTIDRIMNEAIAATNAKYVAICEGDDYWTDPLKLQKQVDFLEEHENYSMCCHGADLINLSDRAVDCLCDRMTTRDYTFEDAFPTWQIPTASIVYNRAKVESFVLKKQECFMAGDVVLILRCMSVGLVHGFKEHMSVYRVHPGGATRMKSTDAITERWCKHLDALALNFPQIDVSYCRRFAAKYYYTRFRKSRNVVDKVRFFAIACAKSQKYVIAKLLMPFGGTKSAILKKWTYVEYS